MSPEQEALVEALRTVSSTDEYNQPPLSLLRYIPSVRSIILALAAERDMYRLKAEWKSAIVDRMQAWSAASAAAVMSNGIREYEVAMGQHEKFQRLEEEARAAYVAAGGVV